MADNNIIGERLRACRKRMQANQADIAELLGVQRQIISYYESGARKPNLEDIQKLADLYNVSVDYLLGRIDVATPSIEIQAICDYTGLNENTVDMLHSAIPHVEIMRDMLPDVPVIHDFGAMLNLMFSDESFIMSFCANFINYFDAKANLERFEEIFRMGNVPLGVDFSNLFLMGMQLDLKKLKDKYGKGVIFCYGND